MRSVGSRAKVPADDRGPSGRERRVLRDSLLRQSRSDSGVSNSARPSNAVGNGGRFSWLDALCYDPLPVGGIAVALLLGTYALLGRPPSVPLLLAGFCGTALVYGLDRAVVPSPEDAVNHPQRRRWVRAHGGWLAAEGGLLFVGGVGALACLRVETLLVTGGLAALAGLHLVPLGRWGRPLKELGLGKPLVVAAAWALGGTILPVVEAGEALGPAAGALAGYRYLFILPNVLLADWADRPGDAATGTGAWPRRGRGAKLRWLATGLLGLAATGAVAASAIPHRPVLLRIDALGPLLMMLAVWVVRPARPGSRLLLDALVAWPVVTAAVAWGLGGNGAAWGT